ncbi:MAG: SIS domain-containing protein [Clostridia bacterium]|nr:SIS domain-containing protein [Clostridia bacterium]MBO4797375.1 SIS domain-containing protein [Candidatus Methanomethylophilaceae archaeon]MBQ4289887.1 SIS domain-containing protein [Clostridia bacterium]
MELIDRYQQAIVDVLYKVRFTQQEQIKRAGELVADAIEHGGKVYLYRICHSIEEDLLFRGGGPIFYKNYNPDSVELKKGDVIILSSVSGRTKFIVDLAWDCMQKGIIVIALTSMSYAVAVDPVHPSGKKLYEFVTMAIDNCAPEAEAMLDVEGIEAKFAAASGIASAFILWSLTAALVEKMLKDGYTPGILKSGNYPGGQQYNESVIIPHYDQYGW